MILLAESQSQVDAAGDLHAQKRGLCVASAHDGIGAGVDTRLGALQGRILLKTGHGLMQLTFSPVMIHPFCTARYHSQVDDIHLRRVARTLRPSVSR